MFDGVGFGGITDLLALEKESQKQAGSDYGAQQQPERFLTQF